MSVNEHYFEMKKNELYRMLNISLEKVPYYRENWHFELPSIDEFTYEFFVTNVPLLEKDVLRYETDRFISDNYDKGKLHVGVTSGTSGNPMMCYKSTTEYLRASMDLWRQRRLWVTDLDTNDNFARFYAFRQKENKLISNEVLRFKEAEIQIPLYDYSENRLDEYWAQLLEFQPRWMHGPSTAIFNLAMNAKKKQLPPLSIELIELNGEYAQTEQIKIIQEVFNCNVTNHYGSREFWGMAFSCSEGHLHILDHSVFIETIEIPNSDSTEIVVTSLKNKAWPLVRYRIGDIGKVYINESCGCNLQGEFSLELVKGRKSDYFEIGDGKLINAILFSGIIRGLSTIGNESNIYQYQVIKHNQHHLEILLCVKEQAIHLTDLLTRQIDQELRTLIDDTVLIDYVITDYIEPDKLTGKCRDFIDLSI